MGTQRIALRVLLETGALIGAMALAGACGAVSAQLTTPRLRLEEIGSGREDAFYVVATLIIGPTESVLWDAQYKVSDGRKLADRIAGTGTRLKAIILSHADHDHYMGAMEVIRRFPGTPVYMTEAGLADFMARSAGDLAKERSGTNPEAPDSLVSPRPLPSTPLTVDGNPIEVIAGLTGDVRNGRASALWIPSLRTALVADLAFNGVHPWLGDSDYASREAWRASLKRIAGMKPLAVVPGHKRDPGAPDSPDILEFMDRYLTDFDTVMQSAATPDDVINAMRQKYPELSNPGLLRYSARATFRK